MKSQEFKIHLFVWIFFKNPTFQDNFLPVTSVEEIIDVCGLVGNIPSPASFLIEILSSVP